jgi:hypothetical protein
MSSKRDPQGRYAQYKAATSQFTTWLTQTCASKMKSSSKSTSSSKSKISTSTTLFIKEAVNFIVKQSITVPNQVYSALSQSIKLRRETMLKLQIKHGDQILDDGHEYFLGLLSQAGRLLKPLVVRKSGAASPNATETSTSDNAPTNRFDYLSDQVSSTQLFKKENIEDLEQVLTQLEMDDTKNDDRLSRDEGAPGLYVNHQIEP